MSGQAPTRLLAAIDVGPLALSEADRACGFGARLVARVPWMDDAGAPADAAYVRARGERGLAADAPTDLSRALTAMSTAAAAGVVVLMRPWDPRTGALAWEGEVSATVGWPAVPAAFEGAWIDAAGRLARASGAEVIVGPIATREGLDALAAHPHLKGLTSPIRLLVDDVWDLSRGLVPGWRPATPFGSAGDRAALVAAIREGRIGLMTEHQPVPWHRLDGPRATVPGGFAALVSAWPLSVRAVGVEAAQRGWRHLEHVCPNADTFDWDPAGVTVPGPDGASEVFAGERLSGAVVRNAGSEAPPG